MGTDGLMATHDDHVREQMGLAPLHGLQCGCRAEIRGEEIHVLPCTPEHAAVWEERLPDMLEDLGLGTIPVTTVEDE